MNCVESRRGSPIDPPPPPSRLRVTIFSWRLLGLNLIENCLSRRSQFVSIDEFQSVARKVICGVPQDSDLGPLFFIVFINDLPAAIKHSIVDIYADNTTLSSSADIEVAHQAIYGHIERICKKLTQKVAVLRKIRRFLPLEERTLYYNAMIKQSMLYGAAVWTTWSAVNIKKVLQLQKRAARVILRADTRANSVQLFKKTRIPFFQEAKIIKKTCSVINQRLNGDCPDNVEDLLKQNCDIHSRQSRHGTTKLVCPHFRRETKGGGGGANFTFSSIRLWNSLNTQLKR